jgi:hypothetical protein
VLTSVSCPLLLNRLSLISVASPSCYPSPQRRSQSITVQVVFLRPAHHFDTSHLHDCLFHVCCGSIDLISWLQLFLLIHSFLHRSPGDT